MHERSLRHLHHLPLVLDLPLGLLKCVVGHCVSSTRRVLRGIGTCQHQVLLSLLLTEELMRRRRLVHPSILADLILLITKLYVWMLVDLHELIACRNVVASISVPSTGSCSGKATTSCLYLRHLMRAKSSATSLTHRDDIFLNATLVVAGTCELVTVSR